jgi:adenosylmethionine-8-amino-7-oxononanoate aminotransferase
MVMTQPEWYNRGLSHVWQPYAQAKLAPPPLPVSHTEGCEIVLEDGRRLIDGISSWWSACHGHNHPALIAAAKAQLDTMPHVMFAGLAHAPAFNLAHRLATLTGVQRAFFVDSGSMAVEVALKIALQYFANQGQPQKNRFICLQHAYHGDSFGAMGVSDPARGMHAAYVPNVQLHPALAVPHNATELAQWKEAFVQLAPSTAALIVEPLVQGAGGMRFYTAEMLRAMAQLCKQHDVLLIADEIMTGFGRLGTMFACEQAGIVPDIMCVGKGLTGGVMTLATTLTSAAVYEAFYSDEMQHALMHGPTFMANPLACAVANASLDLFEHEPRLQQVAAIEAHLREGLQPLAAHPAVKEVRVKGALGVVQIAAPEFNPFALRLAFVEHGIWLRPYKDIIYLMPPFTITHAQLEKMLRAVSVEVLKL